MEDFEKIQTLEQALVAQGYAPDFVYDASQWPEWMREFKKCEFNLTTVINAINGDWRAEWADINQRKYYFWWNIIDKPGGVSGRGLSLAGGVRCDGAGTVVGPRGAARGEIFYRAVRKILFHGWTVGK